MTPDFPRLKGKRLWVVAERLLALPDVDTFGRLRSLRARSALDGVS